ncbi:MAG: hypothetical protein K2G03_02100, partial [Bacilli bacterium]|nr:hypothetical protein [Bacilli bacterium]
MYYPKQIPYLLDQEFQKFINYREYHLKELEKYCMCIWKMKSKDTFDKTIYNKVLPDGCIDIVIDFKNKNICFAGFSSETQPLQLQEEIDFMGVRLKPGAFYAIFHISANQIMDSPISFSQIEKELDLSPILTEHTSKNRIEILKNYLLSKIAFKAN